MRNSLSLLLSAAPFLIVLILLAFVVDALELLDPDFRQAAMRGEAPEDVYGFGLFPICAVLLFPFALLYLINYAVNRRRAHAYWLLAFGSYTIVVMAALWLDHIIWPLLTG